MTDILSSLFNFTKNYSIKSTKSANTPDFNFVWTWVYYISRILQKSFGKQLILGVVGAISQQKLMHQTIVKYQNSKAIWLI